MSYHHHINGVDCYWIEEFRITDVHIRLLDRLVLLYDTDTDEGLYEFGSVRVDRKRPYGNSAVSFDILDEMGVDWEDYPDGSAYESNKEEVDRIHQEIGLVMSIVFSAKSFEPGLYKRAMYGKGLGTGRIWRRESD